MSQRPRESQRTPSLYNPNRRCSPMRARFRVVFNRARGTELWDVHGRRYLDFLAGAGSLNYGHNNPVLKTALDRLHPARRHHAQPRSAHRGQGAVPRGDARDRSSRRAASITSMQFTGPTGTNAVEAALKIARKVTGRTNVIYFTNGFHGVSHGRADGDRQPVLPRAPPGVPLAGRHADAVRRLFRRRASIPSPISSACSPTRRAASTSRPP